MKKAEWQAVYTPRGDMLEKRVRQTLMQLEDKPTHARPKRMVWLAAALVLVLAAAVAVAAGLTRSAKYDAKLLAHHALEEKYGFTRDMDSFFTCSVEEADGQTVVTYRANADIGDFAWKLGDYTVTIRDGKAEASWSNDGEAVSGDFSSDVWDTALLAQGIARRKAGEEWYEITGETLETGESLSGAEKTTPEVSAAGESAGRAGSARSGATGAGGRRRDIRRSAEQPGERAVRGLPKGGREDGLERLVS